MGSDTSRAGLVTFGEIFDYDKTTFPDYICLSGPGGDDKSFPGMVWLNYEVSEDSLTVRVVIMI